jgi:23S rRNA G2069 N7-methylase RlmK/C1962 C5-methylase RlmI
VTAILAITLLSHVAVTVLWFNYQTIITRLVTGDSNFSNIFLTRIPKEEHKFTIHHSTDGGDTWSILYQADLLGVGGIIDIEQYDDILILYTYTDGIYIYRIK